MFKKILYIFIMIVVGISANYFFQEKILYFKQQDYLKEKEKVYEYLRSSIYDKESSTMAIALALSSTLLEENFQDNLKETQIKFHELSLQFRKHTKYKNIWIQLIDKNGTSLARSWTTKHHDSLLKARNDIKQLIVYPRPLSTISVGKFTISFKAIMPMYDKDKNLVGFIEVITHFNSIIDDLKKIGFETILLVDKVYQKNLIELSLNKIFIEGYYVANFKFNEANIVFVKKSGVKRLLSIDKYEIIDEKFTILYPLYNEYNKKIAYFILTKKQNLLVYNSLKQFIQFFKYTIIVLFLFFITIILFLYRTKYIIEKEKKYFKKIMNSSSDIIIISTVDEIIDVNDAFYQFFPCAKDLKTFQSRYGNSIANLFVKEEGFISKTINHISWIEYILADTNTMHKVKIKHKNRFYFFYIQIQPLEKDESRLYTIVLNNITELEESKNRLEHFSKTDALTKIGNRHYFMQEMQRLFKKALYQNESLALIMFDIDFFKKVNDTYGHDIGDKVLMRLAKEVKDLIRNSDVFCRYGGEEFIIIMPKCSSHQAFLKAEYIRKSVEKLSIHPLRALTISLGVTQIKKDDSMKHMLKRVDKALYRSKANGRNCVSLE